MRRSRSRARSRQNPATRRRTVHAYYHATFLKNLESIAAHGLVVGGRSQYGEGYTGHSRGKTFLSEYSGLHFWTSRLEDIAHAESDFHNESDEEEEESVGWTPVGIRIALDTDDTALHEDRIGTLDSGYMAWFVTETLDPEETPIEVWTGAKWVDVLEVDVGKMVQTALKAATPEEGYIELDFDVLVPRKP